MRLRLIIILKITVLHRSQKNGDVVIKFCCPQVYRAQKTLKSKPHTYFRHLHFVISDKAKKLGILKFILKLLYVNMVLKKLWNY